MATQTQAFPPFMQLTRHGEASVSLVSSATIAYIQPWTGPAAGPTVNGAQIIFTDRIAFQTDTSVAAILALLTPA